MPGALNSWNLERYREILGVLIRYGLSDFVENLGRGRVTLPRISPAALRGALLELGPAFVKLGQILSTREELLPPAFREELAKLQDQVPHFPLDVASELVESELGARLEEIYPRFDEVPIAGGSIGQVHRASLADGTEVVVKVRRPGIEAILARDAAIIRHLSDALGGQPQVGDRAARLVNDFIAATESELDYAREADQLERFAWQFEHEPGVRIPRVVREFSSQRILTMTYVPGIKLSQAEGLGADFDRPAAARQLGSNVLKQVFAFGYFHADPHPANVFVQPDQSIGFYDLGLIGELSRSERECLASLLLALIEQDADAAIDALLELAGAAHVEDLPELHSDIAQLMANHFRRLTARAQVHRMLGEILRITSRHRLTLPQSFYLAFKALALLDTAGRRLDPNFDLAGLALPVLRRARPSRPVTRPHASEAVDIGLEALAQLRGLPAAVMSSFSQLNRGQVRIQFEHRGLEGPLERYEQAGNRLSASLFASATALGCLGITGLAVAAHLVGLWQASIAAAGIVAVSMTALLLLMRLGRRSGTGRR